MRWLARVAASSAAVNLEDWYLTICEAVRHDLDQHIDVLVRGIS